MSLTTKSNTTWAETLVEALETHGVRYFCASPGSRSAPLTMAASKRNLITHFDERGMAFHALGLAKGLREPVAIIVTSGTAVANLYPAVMEAYYDYVPLIIITADRPPEMYDTGANQTVDQLKLFGSHVRWYHCLPSPIDAPHYLYNVAASAVRHAKHGPVHLNCPFKGKLIDDGQAFCKPPINLPTHTTANLPNLNYEEGLILVGSNAPRHDYEALSEKIKWPLIGDILSGCHKPGRILKKPRAVIQFGDRFVSRTLLEDVGRPKVYLHVTNHPFTHDPYHLVTHRLEGEFPIDLPERKMTKWYANWKQPLPENSIYASLPDQVYFIGNSLCIRNANAFSHLKRVYANRGCCGIDGNIATATGISRALNEPLTIIVGDLTLLHDLNSLALLHTCEHPITLYVVNNGGGGIFSLLGYDETISTPHNYTFKSIAEMFHISYETSKTFGTFFVEEHTLIEVSSSEDRE